MNGLMSAHRTAPIESRAEQDGLPKVAHDRQVRFETVHPDFREWFRKDVVDEDLAVEAAQQGLHVATIGQIHTRLLRR